MELVRHNVHVWIDKWELNAGDSILNWVQRAIKESGALLIVLSKASVASNWCNKELNAGLMRELEESRVIVLPVLIEDCEIPIFLREKLYADFRTDFEVGLKALIEALAKVTSLDQGRLRTGKTTTDWSETWSYRDGLYVVEYVLIEFSSEMPFTVLTMVTVECSEVVTRKHMAYEEADLGWLGRLMVAEALSDIAAEHHIKLRLDDQNPVFANYGIRDEKIDAEYRVQIRCQRLGEDNGRDQLVNVSNYLWQIRDQVRKLARKPTADEMIALERILSSSW